MALRALYNPEVTGNMRAEGVYDLALAAFGSKDRAAALAHKKAQKRLEENLEA